MWQLWKNWKVFVSFATVVTTFAHLRICMFIKCLLILLLSVFTSYIEESEQKNKQLIGFLWEFSSHRFFLFYFFRIFLCTELQAVLPRWKCKDDILPSSAPCQILCLNSEKKAGYLQACLDL